MPTYGVCASPEHSSIVRDAGFDYIEGSVQSYLNPADSTFDGMAAYAAASVLPIPVCNAMLPGDLKLVGPEADPQRWQAYLDRLFPRAAAAGVKTIIFGSGGARRVPEGVTPGTARKQLLEFLEAVGTAAEPHGVTVAIEPLNQGECNILTTIAEAMTYVDALEHPRVQCLLDSYHFWLEKEPLDNIVEAGGAIEHVHVADHHGRTFPGIDPKSDYVSLFLALKKIGYTGRISIEGRGPMEVEALSRSLEFLKNAWEAA